MDSLGEILIEKLTPGELSELCDAYDDGSIKDIFMGELFSQDLANNSGKYCQIDDV